jgi:diguanylate cyclase (GGDEF)-like protein
MVTEADWDAAQAKTARLRALSAVGGLLPLALASVASMAVGQALSSGVARYPISAGCLMVLLAPVIVWLIRVNAREQNETDSKVRALTHGLAEALASADREAAERDVQARRQRFESRLANALDMAEGEPEVIEVIERSFASALPEAPVELLLADNSHAHLLRMASAPTAGGHPGCGVDSPDHCPAARRAQVQRFTDSEDLDACPKLRNRAEGRLSALCVPVSIMGRTVGVIHATGPPNQPVSDDSVEDLGTLAKLAGARIGLLRVMAETQLAASTDSLTGLLNRRSFEQQVSAIRRSHPVLAVAIADLDHFKELNDTHGHDTGDRALRLFATVIRTSLRSIDITARHGGEEFAIAFPSCTAADARGALDAARDRFDAAITVAGLPKCTASFGVIDAAEHEDLPELIARADAALFEAKRRGRDQVVVHDAAGTALEPSPDGLQDPSPSETSALAAQIRGGIR